MDGPSIFLGLAIGNRYGSSYGFGFFLWFGGFSFISLVVYAVVQWLLPRVRPNSSDRFVQEDTANDLQLKSLRQQFFNK